MNGAAFTIAVLALGGCATRAPPTAPAPSRDLAVQDRSTLLLFQDALSVPSQAACLSSVANISDALLRDNMLFTCLSRAVAAAVEEAQKAAVESSPH